MKRTTFNAIGGWQNFLLCVGMYEVALFFSIFVCSSIFFLANSKSTKDADKVTVVQSAGAKEQLASVNH